MAASRYDIITAVPPCPARPRDGHKGTFGTVIVVGGSATMPGAPALCAGAAFRGGAGLVKIATQRDVIAPAIAIEPGATGIILEDDLSVIGDGVLAVGPGLGRSDRAVDWVTQLLSGSRRVVLDADGLNILAQQGGARQGDGDLILTPHPGEYRRLAEALNIDVEAREDQAAALAQAHRAVVLLKGQQTIVSDGQRIYRNTTGSPALATAGSGDVLTGLIAALCAQGMTSLDAAVLGAYLHGLAGNLWEENYGPSGLKAVDLADLLPQTFQFHRS